MKYLFVLFLIFHGLIHLMGFLKAFGFAQINQLTKEISRPTGSMWLMATLLLIAASVFFIVKKEYWWLIALSGAILSQLLIVFYWHDAKFGTIANVIILAVAIPAWAEWRFENQYKKDVAEAMRNSVNQTEPLLTVDDISKLPLPIQRYIIYSGSINKPVIKNFKIKFKGQIRKDTQSDWMPFTTEQYNFIDPPTRLFYMNATMKGLPVSGYHAYKNGTAIMDIRLLSLFTVQNQSGREMDIAETVTWFNDLCLFAPAALIDKRITWEPMDSLTSKATFSDQSITISAILYFNEHGELINFISDDRYQIASDDDIKPARFSTPAKDYVEINGHRIPSYGEAVWNLAEGDLTYGQFHVRDIEYNINY
jgi:hypothetical protein